MILDCNKKELAELPSQLKAAEYLGVNRNAVANRLASGKIIDTKIGSVYIQDKGGIPVLKNKRGIQIQVLDADRNLLDTCDSLRAAAKLYGGAASSISRTYLDKDKLFRTKYYFRSVST